MTQDNLLSLMRFGATKLDQLSPRLASKVAETLFRTPPPQPPLASKARTFLSSARRLSVRVNRHSVAVYRWGRGPQVYLLHGWAGRATQFHAFVPRLCEAGFEVIAIDAVGHGLSSGRTSSITDFRDSLLAVVASTQRGAVAPAILAHSMGGAATTLALTSGLPVRRVVMVATPTDPRRFLKTLRERLGLSEATMDRVGQRVLERVGGNWDELSVPGVAPRLSTPLLVFHDLSDDAVGWENGAAIVNAWPGSTLVTTQGLGHQRILRDPGVIRRAVEFLTADCPRCASCGRLLHCAGLHCLGCTTSQDLFEREARF